MNLRQGKTVATSLLSYLTSITTAMTTLLSLTVLTGWMTNSLTIARMSHRFIPMAPATALCFFGLSGALLGRKRLPGERILRFWRVLAGVVLFFNAAILIQFVLVSAARVSLDIEQWIAPASLSNQGFIVGRMSPLTAILFFLLSLAALFSFPSRTAGRARYLVSQNAAVIVFILAAILVIGYGYGAPLLYGGTMTPVALPTAIGFILLSTGLLFDGKDAFFFQWVTVASIFSQFTRLIIPGTMAIIIVAGWFHLSVMEQVSPVYQVLSFSLFALFTAGFIALLTILVARQVQTAVTQAQWELKESEKKYRAILDNIEDGYYEVDIVGNLTFFNDSFRRILGYPDFELMGMNNRVFMDRANTEKVYQTFNQVFTTGEPAKVFDWELIRKDGARCQVDTSVSLIRDAQGKATGFRGIIRDVTHRKRMEADQQKLEAQLRQAQKMEAVGRLAGGVAHDFNNMLSVILGYSEMAISKLHPADPLYPDLREISGAAQRSADLTRQLLAFSRKQIIAPKMIEFNTQMKNMERLLKRIIGEDIDLKFNLSPDLWPVFLDPSQVDQTVANLAVNSRDAMPDGGMLTVETCNVTFDEAYCQSHPGYLPGDYVLLAVSDTGSGMDKETLEHLFEPFFTTKPDGKGTGLGLATVYGAVRQNNGFINVYSEPGQGTTFKLYFPRHPEEIRIPSIESRKTDAVRGHGTILLVEDQDQLRRLAKTMLEHLGYTVLDAASPGEAFVVCEKYTGEIHLLFTDVVMPTMNGKEMAERIQSLRPGLTTLFMSGYTADAIAHRGMLDPGLRFLQKPFSMNALAEKIAEAMNS